MVVGSRLLAAESVPLLWCCVSTRPLRCGPASGPLGQGGQNQQQHSRGDSPVLGERNVCLMWQARIKGKDSPCVRLHPHERV